MQLTKTQKIIISVIAVIILLAVYIVSNRNSREQVQPIATSTEEVIVATTTTLSIDSNTKITGGYKIELDTSKTLPQPIPDLDRPTLSTSYAVVAPEAKALASAQILNLQAKLKNNPGDLSTWLDLAMREKANGDYQGAIISWKYASRLAPTNFISLANIGNLYAYFLKDNAQAEIYYKQAIIKGPTQAYLYTQLAEIYRDIFQDLEKAKSIIDQGLSKLPNDPSLLQFQQTLK